MFVFKTEMTLLNKRRSLNAGDQVTGSWEQSRMRSNSALFSTFSHHYHLLKLITIVGNILILLQSSSKLWANTRRLRRVSTAYDRTVSYASAAEKHLRSRYQQHCRSSLQGTINSWISLSCNIQFFDTDLATASGLGGPCQVRPCIIDARVTCSNRRGQTQEHESAQLYLGLVRS
jgi:hypothetical protein